MCDVNANCENTIGSYDCVCVDGYVKNGSFCMSKYQRNFPYLVEDSLSPFYQMLMNVLKALMIAMTTLTVMTSLVVSYACAVLVTLVMGWKTVQVRNCHMLNKSYHACM